MKLLNEKDAVLRAFELYDMLDAFDEKLATATVRMGKAIMKPGVRVPEVGMKPHDQDEFSYIVKGTMKSQVGDEHITLYPGDFSFIPKNTPHWSENVSDEDCELIWLLVGEV